MVALEDSFRYCRRVARSRARNFYYSFLLLEQAPRDAMCAIYAFMRYCDDLSDEPGANPAAIERWRAALNQTFGGQPDEHPVWPAFAHTVQAYGIPHEYFQQMIDGVASDLEPRRIATYDELYRYCYQVASVVGLTTIHIFGFDAEEAKPLAVKCGVAFQLTNILRDIKEDADKGRTYLPAEDLAKFGITPEQLARGEGTTELLRFEAGRARSYYRESAPLLELVHQKSRSSLWALVEIYSRLLDRIERANYDVYSRRISVPVAEKLWILLRAAI